MAVTLINAFIVPPEQEEAFLRNWKETSAYFAKCEGFIETHMHRNSGVGNPTFTFINIARWTSAEAWRDTHDLYQPKENLFYCVKGNPEIFTNIIDIAHGDGHPHPLFQN